MAVVFIQAKLTTEDLMAAIEQLEPEETEKITRRLLHLQARRRVSHLPEQEAELLQIIYREKRPGFQERFDLLNEKRRTFTLSPEEQDELVRLADEAEVFTVQRLQALGELAKLRQLTLPALMKQLGLKAPTVA